MSTNINFIQRALDITKNNLILAQPLILFFIVLSFTLVGLTRQENRLLYALFYISNILLCTAFYSGWFYMIKKAIQNHNKTYSNPKEKAAASLALGNEFFPGVGEYFIPITYTIIVLIVISILTIFVSYKVGVNYLPNPNIDLNKFIAMGSATTAEIQDYVFSLGFEKIKALNIWISYIFIISFIFSFLTMFLFPVVYDKNNDKKDFILFIPFIVFNRNLMFLFKNFFGALGILIFLMFLNFVFLIISAIFNINLILSVIWLIFSFYFMTYALVLIFLYYEEKK